MCGIVGVVRFDGRPVEEGLLVGLREMLRHRGPDDRGLYLSGPVGLAHCRLSIIDLEGGRQPMSRAACRIVYNGEIYNFLQKRQELTRAGVHLSTRSDTEVILALYEEHGEKCVEHLRGMFAFAIWDEERRKLFLARDRVGIKPLYYYDDGDFLVFASELKAVAAHPDVPTQIDPGSLIEYLTYGYILAPRTIYRGVKKLPAGHLLVADERGVSVREYWDLSVEPVVGRSEGDYAEALRETLAEAVRLHMVSDVPIGVFLSGGLDSSTVATLMAQAAAQPINTFSVGFEDDRRNELPYARLLAERIGANHHELILKPADLELVPELVRAFDEPFADSSCLPTYLVSQAAREHLKVVLTGDGGDEAFAGYKRYGDALELAAARGDADRAGSGCARVLLERWPVMWGGRRQLTRRALSPFEHWARSLFYFDPQTLAWLLSQELNAEREQGAARDIFARARGRVGEADFLSQLQYVDVKSYLVGDILTKVDRMSMRTSLETRVPLLDHKVLEAALAIPAEVRMKGGERKYILKRALADDLPRQILEKPKRGFSIPLARWFREDWYEFARETLLSSEARGRGFVRPGRVETMLRWHRRGWKNFAGQLWALLALELWCSAPKPSPGPSPGSSSRPNWHTG
jgi:asparagine synthase (glutamine-hydrolysing)